MRLTRPPSGREGAGAGSRSVQEDRQRYVPRGASNVTPVVAASASGARITDIEGRTYIDFAGGIGTLNVGHGHPRVVEAIHAQVDRLIHACFHVTMYPPYVELARRLTEITPGVFPKKTLLINSGAEAVENAVKIARAATGRPAVIAFDHAFHGRTLMGLSLTGKEVPYRAGFGPFAPEVHRAPYPYPYRPPFGVPRADVGRRCLEFLDALFETTVSPGRVAAIIVEPVAGEGGFIVPPEDFLPGLRACCDRHGILLIADEVQTGFGRTGRMFAVEHAGVVPDVLMMAKSLAGGLPLAAVVGRAEVMDAPAAGALGSTFGGNPVACAAALAVLDVLDGEGLVARAQRIGARISEAFHAWSQRFPIIGDARGLGAMQAIELVRDRASREPATQETRRIVERCYDRGLIVLSAGMHGNVIRVLVPLVVEEDELVEGLTVLEEALAEVCA